MLSINSTEHIDQRSRRLPKKIIIIFADTDQLRNNFRTLIRTERGKEITKNSMFKRYGGVMIR